LVRKAGSLEGRSIGLLACGGIFAPEISPSLALILIGVAGHISIKNSPFFGGIVPGLMMGAGHVSVWNFLMRSESMPSLPKANWGERLTAIKEGFSAPNRLLCVASAAFPCPRQ